MVESETDAELGFEARHIGLTVEAVQEMLKVLGLSSVEELIDQTVPDNIRSAQPLDLPPARSETDAIARLAEHAAANRTVTSLIGQGYYRTITPAVIQRNVLENPAWYTAYTPYQPEISQGRLEALLNFQTAIADLVGLDMANASLLDEATAAAEAMALCRRHSKAKSNAFFVDDECHPQVIEVIRTRAEPLGIEVVLGSAADSANTEVFGAVLAQFGTTGRILDPAQLAALATALHGAGALVAATTDLLGCVIFEPPGSHGVDIAVGSAQRFGVPVGFGGPHAAFMATTDALKRSIPGRLVGTSIDSAGQPAHRLALQTREQHIRREKATSNICTAQVLLAVLASMYAVYHGPGGLRTIARRIHRLTSSLAEGLVSAGYELDHDTFFDTLTVRSTTESADSLIAAALAAGYNLRALDGAVGISLDEACDERTVEDLLAVFGAPSGSATPVSSAAPAERMGVPTLAERYWRSQEPLRFQVFNRYRTETEMLRYLRRLADKDLALDRSMIPLGSCTMKLNATSEMLPVTWPEFAEPHPFAPADQTAGYRAMIAELEAWLCEVTGYAAASIQPNAGSQGELAGLLAIRAYHHAQGDTNRTICLIPSSAHGTNAASAVMAGMSVKVVACDDRGNVDLDSLEQLLAEHGPDVAAIMITYPSTHGVFESTIVRICDMVHAAGGQVYLDGANLNALVGLARPGEFGSDVSHLNLHKTFCIPHGGGGPGVGPVVVREHLAAYLPASSVEAGDAVGMIAAAPFGSASILPISWMYIAMMGADGLRRATCAAILAANYIAARLGEAYPVLYTGEHGRVAHECIIDLRPITKATGVTNDDVAKRLIDYGFHAPTMSFPVAGTLMIEPTESESLTEIDRFCDAMLAIRAEIDLVVSGDWPAEDHPLRHAPHTAAAVCADEWDHAYPRSVAAYPPGVDVGTKYWAPVGRIDGGYGDRNLICSCPPPEAFEGA